MSDVEYIEINSEGWGSREIEIMGELLNAWNGTGSIKIGFNPNSGYVFLVDDNEDVYMMNGDDLEQFHSCPNCGNEGFIEEIKENMDNCSDCEELMRTFSDDDQCNCCKEWVNKEDLEGDLCTDCSNDKGYCENCNEYRDKNEMHSIDICEYCFEDQEDDVEIQPIAREDLD